jgi:hypothetical protein
MLTYFLKNVQSMYFMQQKIITETQLHKKLWSTTKKNNTTNKKRKQNQQEPKARARPKRSEPAIESTARTHAHQLESNNPHPTKEVRGCLQNNASKGEHHHHLSTREGEDQVFTRRSQMGTLNEVSYEKDCNRCCRHRQESEELSLRPPNPTPRNYLLSLIERQTMEKQRAI